MFGGVIIYALVTSDIMHNCTPETEASGILHTYTAIVYFSMYEL